MKKTFLLLIILGLAIYACDDNPGADDTDLVQPEIPPVQTLNPDLSELTGNSEQKNKNRADSLEAGDNFKRARQQGGKIATFLGANVAFPASLLTGAASTEPQQTEPGTWVWEFTHTNPLTGGTLKSELTAAVEQDSGFVDWQLTLDSEGNLIEFQNFRILGGRSALDGTTGNWDISLFSRQTDEQNLVTSNEWVITRDSLITMVSTIKLEGSPLAEDTFEFIEEDSTKQLQFTDTSENSVVNIAWRPLSGEGRLTDPEFNNGEPACWSANKENISCELAGF